MPELERLRPFNAATMAVSDAEMQTSDAELETSDAALETSDADLETSDAELESTSAGEDPDATSAPAVTATSADDFSDDVLATSDAEEDSTSGVDESTTSEGEDAQTSGADPVETSSVVPPVEPTGDEPLTPECYDDSDFLKELNQCIFKNSTDVKSNDQVLCIFIPKFKNTCRGNFLSTPKSLAFASSRGPLPEWLDPDVVFPDPFIYNNSVLSVKFRVYAFPHTNQDIRDETRYTRFDYPTQFTWDFGDSVQKEIVFRIPTEFVKPPSIAQEFQNLVLSASELDDFVAAVARSQNYDPNTIVIIFILYAPISNGRRRLVEDRKIVGLTLGCKSGSADTSKCEASQDSFNQTSFVTEVFDAGLMSKEDLAKVAPPEVVKVEPPFTPVDDSLGGGAIFGIVLACVVAVGIAVAAAVLFLRNGQPVYRPGDDDEYDDEDVQKYTKNYDDDVSFTIFTSNTFCHPPTPEKIDCGQFVIIHTHTHTHKAIVKKKMYINYFPIF